MDQEKRKVVEKAVEKVTRKLTDEGRIIEAGWQGLRLLTIPDDAPAMQLEEMRNAFFAGAQHLFASILTMLDADSEPTENDARRMDQIDAELKRFVKEYAVRHKL